MTITAPRTHIDSAVVTTVKREAQRLLNEQGLAAFEMPRSAAIAHEVGTPSSQRTTAKRSSAYAPGMKNPSLDDGLDEFDAPPTEPDDEPQPFSSLPDHPAITELKSRARWVAWRYETRNGKPTKPPVSPHSGVYASCSNPATWGTYEHAERCAMERGLPGVGYVLGDGDGDLTGIDLDKCRDPVTGKLKPWAREIVDLKETYNAVSPSGTGIRLFARGKVRAAIKYDLAKVELYGTGRYLTVTGRGANAINPAPKTLATCAARAERHQKRWATLAAAGPDIATAVKTEAVKERKGSWGLLSCLFPALARAMTSLICAPKGGARSSYSVTARHAATTCWRSTATPSAFARWLSLPRSRT